MRMPTFRNSLGSEDAGPEPEPALMILLSSLFFLRVLAQLCVSRRRLRFLPPMEQWQSGLLPYPALLAAQGAILGVQIAVDIQSCQGRGLLVASRPRLGRGMRLVSLVYFGSMVFRYGLSMRRHPDRRWFGQTIPIAFHCVLATYLFLYAKVFRKPESGVTRRAAR